jgi:hypothetical protein
MAEELGEEVGVRDVPVDGVDPGAREESRAATLERGVVVAVEVVEAEHAVPSAAWQPMKPAALVMRTERPDVRLTLAEART